MAFWGCVLKPGQKTAVKLAESDVLHLSQACLHDPKPGKNVLQVEVQGTTYSIACLEKDKRDHDCLDLFFESATSFTCKGSSEIHLMGYVEPQDMNEDSEEEESPPKAVASKSSPKRDPVPSPKTSPKTSPKAAMAAAAEDSEEDFEDEESEEEAAAPAAAGDSEDDLEDEEEEEEGAFLDEEGEESSGEEISVGAPLKPVQSPNSPKRKAADEAEHAAKRAKQEAAVNSEKEAYIAKLIAYLKANGKTSTGNLGSKVPRPSGLPKMKPFFEQHKDKFTVVGDAVTLK